ncbi:MAG TPA: 3D-(3,5/4)-trihydroxycyclohexane-1,2-dione acylhydrolase (decyclizing) [Woeseiaceae bacterium]|nr:3D-(3,5/4)-trihydroxycyclohexane-1,2-dione acylhydrolase (decyclizing) [Woeseiaceae bacterium]
MAHKTIRLTMAQALVRYLAAQRTEVAGEELPLVAGVFAIFGHGNVAGLGEALQHHREELPVYRAHNEQAMAHAAIAFAKASKRRRLMACTTSIGPGATNMVTAAALAHVNRLPLLLLPGETFASRRPDPVLQQVEDFTEPGVTANDCFRPVARFWDRIVRPEQLVASLPQAMSVLSDPADCGPVVLALPQDVQAEAFDYPASMFEEAVRTIEKPRPDQDMMMQAADWLRTAKRPLVIVGGGVHYSNAFAALDAFVTRLGIPFAETQAGKGALPWNHPLNAGAIGVTGSSAANRLAAEADLVVALGTRLQDFTTASNTLFAAGPRIIGINVNRHDAIKRGALPLRGDAAITLAELDAALPDLEPHSSWTDLAAASITEWNQAVDAATGATASDGLPGDADVLGVVNRAAGPDATVVCASGGLPGELHKLWRAHGPDSYHLEYGYSCMGYEIAGAVGVKLAKPERNVIVLVGDGSYLMMNSEIATSVMLGLKLTIVLLDNRGFGCINRLQQSCGGASFNNLLPETPDIDFAAHARSLGAEARAVRNLEELEQALDQAATAARTQVIVIETDPAKSTSAGGAWWDVPVPEISDRPEVQQAFAAYEKARNQ